MTLTPMARLRLLIRTRLSLRNSSDLSRKKKLFGYFMEIFFLFYHERVCCHACTHRGDSMSVINVSLLVEYRIDIPKLSSYAS